MLSRKNNSIRPSLYFRLVRKGCSNSRDHWMAVSADLDKEQISRKWLRSSNNASYKSSRSVHARAFTTRDNIHLYSVTVDTKFLGNLGPVIHDMQGQSNVRSYAAKRQSGKKWGDLIIRMYVHIRDATRCARKDACMHFICSPAYSGISSHRWLHRRRTVNAFATLQKFTRVYRLVLLLRENIHWMPFSRKRKNNAAIRIQGQFVTKRIKVIRVEDIL